jgi:sugar O-acyltransferase (sialic acid O-acetyltransferase NeuD family)
MEKIVIYGAGNVGKKALESLIRQNVYCCGGFLDDNLDKGTLVQNIPVIGGSNEIDIVYEKGINNYFVALGNNFFREKISSFLRNKGFNLVSIIDPSAFVSCEASIGEGVLVMPNCYIGHGAVLEDFSVCQVASIISHYAKIGRAVNLSYGSIVSAYANIGKFSRIGIGAKIMNKINIGESSFIGAGAVVTQNIPSKVLAFGIPARVIREIDLENYNPNCKGGEKNE